MKILTIQFIFPFLLFYSSSYAQESDKKNYQVACIGFYNIENLFDTINDPNVNDEDFLPEGSYKWTGKRYWEKLDHMSYVLDELCKEYTTDGPAIMGFCEVENRTVVQDLINQPRLKKHNYKIIHIDGPYDRGVDPSLIYQEKYFKVTNQIAYPVKNPNKPEWKTRDQLLVSGVFADGKPLHIVVNHWPSRRGGEERSAPLRGIAADVGRRIADSLLNQDPNARIIYMGDLNDDPSDKSVRKNLGAVKRKEDLKEKLLFNTSYDLFEKGVGSLAHNDSWNLFDQIIISSSLLNGDANQFKFFTTRVFNKPFLQQADGRFKGYPFRTYSGGVYTNGYSDHFPVFTVIVREANK
jgi:hypothetical protein